MSVRNFPTVKARLNQRRNFIPIPLITTLNGRTGAPNRTHIAQQLDIGVITVVPPKIRSGKHSTVRVQVVLADIALRRKQFIRPIGPIHCLTHERKRGRARERERKRARKKTVLKHGFQPGVLALDHKHNCSSLPIFPEDEKRHARAATFPPR